MDIAELERTTMKKAYWRLLPYCFLLYILCYIDRINVGFASLTMNKDLGLTAYIYGLAAGAFFWGYCLLEVPSNIIMEKVGARIWITRIMVTWGLLSAATAFVTGPWSFFTVRVLIGAAEAGLFPGILLYFHRWFPQHHRGRVSGAFLLGLPLATAIGAPLSTAFLQLEGIMGLHGWQWMYLGEGIPTAVVGVTKDLSNPGSWSLAVVFSPMITRSLGPISSGVRAQRGRVVKFPSGLVTEMPWLSTAW